MKAKKRKPRTKKARVIIPKGMKDSYLPLNLQAGGETKEKLNDDDCRSNMLKGETQKLQSSVDEIIRHAIPSLEQDKIENAKKDIRPVNSAFETAKPLLEKKGWRHVPRNINCSIKRGEYSFIISEALKFETENFEATVIPYRGGIELVRAVNNSGGGFIGVFETTLVNFLIQYGIDEFYMQPYHDKLFDKEEELQEKLPIIEYNLNMSGYKKIDGEYRAELDMKSFLELPHENTDFNILHTDAIELHKKVSKEYMELSVRFYPNQHKGFRTYINILDSQALPQKLNSCIQTFPCSDEKKKTIEGEFQEIFGKEKLVFSTAAEGLYETIGEFIFDVENAENYKELLANIGFCLVLLHNLEYKGDSEIIEGFFLDISSDKYYTEPIFKTTKNNKGTSVFKEIKNAKKLPLPSDISWALNAARAGYLGQVDEFIKLPEKENMTEFMYEIFAGGIKSNMSILKISKKEWNNIIGLSTSLATGEVGVKYNIYTDYRFRIHLEALRLITRKSLMEILYHGEISVQNEFDETDNEMYLMVCDKIWSLVEKKPDLDLSQLTLKDL